MSGNRGGGLVESLNEGSSRQGRTPTRPTTTGCGCGRLNEGSSRQGRTLLDHRQPRAEAVLASTKGPPDKGGHASVGDTYPRDRCLNEGSSRQGRTLSVLDAVVAVAARPQRRVLPTGEDTAIGNSEKTSRRRSLNEGSSRQGRRPSARSPPPAGATCLNEGVLPTGEDTSGSPAGPPSIIRPQRRVLPTGEDTSCVTSTPSTSTASTKGPPDRGGHWRTGNAS